MLVQNNSLVKMIMRRRWLRRWGIFCLPERAWLKYEQEKFYVDTKDWRGPSYHVVKWGIDSYEPENLNFLLKILKGQKDFVFFDIGANIGIFSFLLAKNNPQLSVYAFEPDPTTYSCLEKTFDSPNLRNVSVHAIALSDKNGEATFYNDEKNHGGHSLNIQSIHEENGAVGNSFSVSTMTLDYFVEMHQIQKVDFLKIYVQRHEAEVLSGARKVLEKYKPIILMECYLQDLRSEKSLVVPLFDLGYVALEPHSSKVYKMYDVLKNESFQAKDYVDLVFCSAEQVVQFC
jgi:FkbM family methyltransferase